MSVVSNALVIPDRQQKYVKMLHEMLLAHSVSYGKAANFALLVPKLVHSDQFRVEFSMLVQWIQRQEEKQLTLDQMVTILWIATTGSSLDGLRKANTAPLMIFLSGLGGWHETEADHVTVLEGASARNAPEAAAPLATFTTVGRKDEEREVRDRGTAAASNRRRLMFFALFLLPVLPPLILCVVLYRNHAEPPRGVPSEAATNAGSAAYDVQTTFPETDILSRVSPHRQPGVENKAEKTEPRPSEQENTPWPVSGFAVLGENGQLTFDQTPGISSFVTEPAKIHTPKPEAAPTIAEGARMPTVVPEAIVTMSYPTIVAREAPRPETDRSKTSVVEPARGQTAIADSDRGRPNVADSANGRAGLAAPDNGRVSAADSDRSRAGVAAPDSGRTGAVVPDGGRTGVAGTESKAPAMPVVVASSTEPPVATVARAESRSTAAVKGKSSSKPFDMLHPRVAVSAGLLSIDIVKFQMPSYPKSAQKQRLVGDVLVRVLISEKGKVARVVALNGPPSLRQSVEKAVSRWRYVPYMENGKPVMVQTWVTFHFEMRES